MEDTNRKSKLKINMGGKKLVHELPNDTIEHEQTDNDRYLSSRIKKSTKNKDNSEQYYPWHSLSPVKEEALEKEDVTIVAPNPHAKPQKFDWISIVFQPLGALVGVAVLLVVLHLSGAGLGAGIYMLIGGLSGGLGVVWGLLRFRSQKKEGENAGTVDTEKYREYLTSIETKLKESASNQHRAMNYESPSICECTQMNEKSDRLWFRNINSKNFMSVRLGRGKVKLSHRIVTPEKHYSEENPLLD